jgi:catechol 2,3-dioxygenase-like lactoylglutathione lyase family enzyme
MTPKLNAIGLVVADLATSVAFYRRLGLAFTDDVADGHVECALSHTMKLMLDSEDMTRSITPDWSRPTGSPRGALAFELDSPADVDAMYAELLQAGAGSVHAPWDAPWGHRYAMLLDPDGNGVDLYAPLAQQG